MKMSDDGKQTNQFKNYKFYNKGYQYLMLCEVTKEHTTAHKT